MTGSVQSIAVGSMMRCIVANVANQIAQDDMMALLSPRQLDFELKRAAEAAAHELLMQLDLTCVISILKG